MTHIAYFICVASFKREIDDLKCLYPSLHSYMYADLKYRIAEICFSFIALCNLRYHHHIFCFGPRAFYLHMPFRFVFLCLAIWLFAWAMILLRDEVATKEVDGRLVSTLVTFMWLRFVAMFWPQMLAILLCCCVGCAICIKGCVDARERRYRAENRERE